MLTANVFQAQTTIFIDETACYPIPRVREPSRTYRDGISVVLVPIPHLPFASKFHLFPVEIVGELQKQLVKIALRTQLTPNRS